MRIEDATEEVKRRECATGISGVFRFVFLLIVIPLCGENLESRRSECRMRARLLECARVRKEEAAKRKREEEGHSGHHLGKVVRR